MAGFTKHKGRAKLADVSEFSETTRYSYTMQLETSFGEFQICKSCLSDMYNLRLLILGDF